MWRPRSTAGPPASSALRKPVKDWVMTPSLRLAAVGLEPVTVRIDDEGRVVIAPVVGAHAGLAVVASPGVEGGRMKGAHTLAARGIEAEVKPGLGIGRHRLIGRPDPQDNASAAVAQSVRRLTEAGVAERGQGRIVEAL